MKNKIQFTIVAVSLVISLVGTSCHPDQSSNLSSTSLEINQFIWSGLSQCYLWTDSVTNLSPSKYSNESALNSFLNNYPDHEKLFNSLLYTKRDKWSWIVDDYTALEKQFEGITTSMGYEFGLIRISSTSNDILGYVRYVVKGSPAYRAGVKRGDIFIKINNQQLTIDNYQTLLNNSSYTLSFATISNNTIYPSSRQLSMTAEVVQENPIFLDTVYTVNSTRIGYLVYNQFVSDYDLQLNNVFSSFKSQGIQQLVLDLRYNPGGSVQSAIYLSSMIYSTDTNKVILKVNYNKLYQDYYMSKSGVNYFNSYFAASIQNNSINTLNLQKIYIIATGSTASASELVINSLRPYMQVEMIGDTTVGKYVASTTLYDYDSTGIPNGYGDKVNRNHKYAMQPIILKIANSQGKSDFYNGLAPDIRVDEYAYLGSFLPLGDLNEPLLHAAINSIEGAPQKKTYFNSQFRVIADSKDLVPHAKEMYVKPREMRKFLSK
jgi:carboxyl-terminal processing protease